MGSFPFVHFLIRTLLKASHSLACPTLIRLYGHRRDITFRIPERIILCACSVEVIGRIMEGGGAAAHLGFNPSTLRSRMKKFRLSRPTPLTSA
jgi:hypothetical protein